MKSNIFFYSWVASVFFILGLTSKNLENSRIPSSTATESINSYDNLTCPDEAAKNEYLKHVEIDFGEHAASCSDPYAQKIFKLLHLAKNLRVALPENWGGVHRQTLQDPFTYITGMTKKWEIDLRQQSTIASNYRGQKIYIGSLFFELEPLNALQVLIHENRHSSPADPGHVTCRTGDIPKSSAACDEEFSISHSAGAYAHGFVFLLGLGLYGENISNLDREFMIDTALAGITSRFNRVPDSLALPLDILWVLKNQKVYQVHPFTFDLLEVRGLPTLEAFTPVRLQYDPITHGVLIFSSQGIALVITPQRKIRGYYDDLLPEDFFLVDSTKMYSSAGEYAYTYFVNDQNKIFFKDVDLQSGTAFLADFRRTPDFKIKKFFTGNVFTPYFLSTEGALHKLINRGKGAVLNAFPIESSFISDSVRWLDATGGATYDALIAVGDDGLVYQEEYDSSRRLRAPVKTDFRFHEKAIKYQEGLNFKAALSEQGHIFIRDYPRRRPDAWKLPIEDITDFAWGRAYTPTATLRSPAVSASNWSQRCGVSAPQLNPWTGEYFGLNSRGYLVFSDKDTCDEFINIPRASLSPPALRGSALYEAFNHFSQVHVELISPSQEPVRRFPYDPLYEEDTDLLPY